MTDKPANQNEPSEQDAATLEPISPKLRQRLASCFDHAIKLAEGDDCDCDYVHTLLTQCVSADPANLVYVEAMFKNLQKKYKNNKKGGKIRATKAKAALKKALTKKEWAIAVRMAPDVFHANPWDVQSLRGIAEACEQLQLNEVELRYLKMALDGAPKNAEVNRHCAKSLSRMGQFDMAISCWHRVEESDKSDKEAPKAIAALSLEKSRAQAGFEDEEEEKTSDSPTTKKEQKQNLPSEEESADAPAAIKLTPRQRLEQAILDDPTQVKNYLQLAGIHTEAGRHDEAEQLFKDALDCSGGDLAIRVELENAQMTTARTRLAIAERQAKAEQTNDNTELAKQLRSDLLRLESQIYAARCERHPDDKELLIELGLRLKWSGQFSEAIATFQKAGKGKSHKCRANLEMGECFQRARKYDKALICYERALKSALPEDEENRRLTLYRAGVLAAGLNQNDKAKAWLAELLEIEPGYRDVASRLDKLRSIHDKG